MVHIGNDHRNESGMAASLMASTRDETDYEHRNLVNLIAVAALLVIAIAIVWTFKAIDDSERTQRCFATGRRDCVNLGAAVPPRSVISISH